MKIDKFEDIQAWQKGKELTLFMYSIFNENKDYRFRDQIQAASVSIMNNIFEKVYNLSIEVSKMLAGFINKIQPIS